MKFTFFQVRKLANISFSILLLTYSATSWSNNSTKDVPTSYLKLSQAVLIFDQYRDFQSPSSISLQTADNQESNASNATHEYSKGYWKTINGQKNIFNASSDFKEISINKENQKVHFIFNFFYSSEQGIPYQIKIEGIGAEALTEGNTIRWNSLTIESSEYQLAEKISAKEILKTGFGPYSLKLKKRPNANPMKFNLDPQTCKIPLKEKNSSLLNFTELENTKLWPTSKFYQFCMSLGNQTKQ